MSSKMEAIHELLGYERLKIVQNPEMFRFSLDSLLLADFARIRDGVQEIIDLGCGNAPIPLFLTLKTKARITGVEIQKEVFELGEKSVRLNGLEDQIRLINADIKAVSKTLGANLFDVAIANPPYFKAGPKSNLNKTDALSVARHELKITFEELVIEAKRLLKNGGSFNLIHRTERIGEVLEGLRRNGFGVRRLRFVHPKKENPALLFLLEAWKNGKEDVKVERPLYVYENGEYSEEVRGIFNYKKNKYNQ